MTPTAVTVIVSSYNRPTLLHACLMSVRLAALHCAWQRQPRLIDVIVVDDYSSPELFKNTKHDLSFLNRIPTVRSRTWMVPPGGPPASFEERIATHSARLAAAVNAALEQVQIGSYVTYLCDDDMLTPSGIEDRAQALDSYAECNMVFGRLVACHSTNGKLEPFVHMLSREHCRHDLNTFYADSEASPAGKVDHNQIMHRALPGLRWPSPSAEHRCADAAFLAEFERRGLGPAIGVPAYVAVKRYHSRGHGVPVQERE